MLVKGWRSGPKTRVAVQEAPEVGGCTSATNNIDGGPVRGEGIRRRLPKARSFATDV